MFGIMSEKQGVRAPCPPNHIDIEGIDMASDKFTRLCSVEGCGRPHSARSYCANHYQWFRRRAALQDALTDDERFDCKYIKTGGCWLWQAATNKGYGVFRVGPKNVAAHRYQYARHNDDIDSYEVIRHLCHTRNCVNPAHLCGGTHQDNCDDKHKAGRNRVARGENSGRARLCSADVVKIREMLREGITMVDIGKAFGVAPNTIEAVKIGRTWAHVP